VAAAAITLLILLLTAAVLLHVPQNPVPVDAGPAMRLRLIAPSHAVSRPMAGTRTAAPATPPDKIAPRSGVRHATAPGPIRMPEPAHDRPTPAAPSNLTQQLYTADGQVRLPDNAIAATSARPPPGSLARDPHAEAEAKRLLERPDPIDYKPTRFDKDWASDGNLLDLATQQAGQALAGMFGKKHRDESRHARPPPDVRFNPALHERPEDLGSEATGDAYKAAPIAFEKVPDLKGGASRRIRAGIAELRSRRSGCGDNALDRWLSPVQAHLNELQKVEYKLAHGADPVSAEHLLPGLADSAYDLARRALWYADRKLASCTPAG
jgi:hypothetical protein